MNPKPTRSVLTLVFKAMTHFQLNVAGQRSQRPPPALLLLLLGCLPPSYTSSFKTAGDVFQGGHLWAHPELCPHMGAKTRLIILITSAPTHWDARSTIRRTWGRQAKERKVVVAFFLGRAEDHLMQKIQEEDIKYRDIVMGPSWDSYKNLTLKVLSMLEWTLQYCPLAKRLLKTDDDVFINVSLLLIFIADQAHAKATRTIWGSRKKGWKMRYIYLPSYVKGAAYLMTVDCVVELMLAAPNVTYVNLEDAFITGLVAHAVGLHRVYVDEFYKTLGNSTKKSDVIGSLAIHTTHKQFDHLQQLLELEIEFAQLYT